MMNATSSLRMLSLLLLATLISLFVALPAMSLDEVAVQLKWVHQAQFAGFYAAEAQGYYEEKGVDVTFIPGGIGIDIFAGVADGSIEFAVVGADSVVDMRSQGMPIKAIATTYRINPFILVAFGDSGIESPYDFPGHVVAITSDYSEAQFDAMLANVGVDPASFTVVPYQYDDAPFLAGDVDVQISFAAGTLLPLREKIGNRTLNIIWPDDYGVHFYSDTIIVNESLLASNPDLVLRFLRATLRGHQFAIADLEAAVDAIMPYAVVQDREVQMSMLEASIPLIFTGEDVIGWMRSDVWEGMYCVLDQHGLLAAPFDITDAYTMQFLEAIYADD